MIVYNLKEKYSHYFHLFIYRKDRRMALIEMQTVEEAIVALIVSFWLVYKFLSGLQVFDWFTLLIQEAISTCHQSWILVKFVYTGFWVLKLSNP
jgi:hypothetical protein